jgi:alpha-L-glutamate ligase-like protein
MMSLFKHDILGINKRNIDYISRYNQRKYYPLVDNKIKTKQLAKQANIAVPELYGILQVEHQLELLPKLFAEYNDFVIKPACGAGGDGILVIIGQQNGKFKKADGKLLTYSDLEYHISNILSGMYSLGGIRDCVMFEYRADFSSDFNTITYLGVPDLRIIVLQGTPIMAMLRLPTCTSKGKANLHQGAIGAGVDLATGMTLDGVYFNQRITHHPDTNHKIAGIKIPYWETCLANAAKCYAMTKLGYIGVDILLDKTKGSLLVEINARPGLNIQIANNAGLLSRLSLLS